jgi:hypothetical protein
LRVAGIQIFSSGTPTTPATSQSFFFPLPGIQMASETESVLWRRACACAYIPTHIRVANSVLYPLLSQHANLLPYRPPVSMASAFCVLRIEAQEWR